MIIIIIITGGEGQTESQWAMGEEEPSEEPKLLKDNCEGSGKTVQLEIL